MTALLPVSASAQWNAGNDEANRQSMMADMRASAAANDRANEDSQRRFNDNAARSLGSNSSGGGGGSSSGSTSGGGGFGSNVGAYRGGGPRSVVKTYTFTIRSQESVLSLITRLGQEASAGNALSAYNLGRVYYTGFDGLPRDDAKAREWFGAGAKLGHPGAVAIWADAL